MMSRAKYLLLWSLSLLTAAACNDDDYQRVVVEGEAKHVYLNRPCPVLLPQGVVASS